MWFPMVAVLAGLALVLSGCGTTPAKAGTNTTNTTTNATTNTTKKPVSGGDMLSLYGVVNKDVSDKASVMPSVVSGIAGFLAGGMLVAGAFLRYSKKHHGNQYTLLTGPEVA